MDEAQKKVFYEEYMPYIIRCGKLTCWLSIPLIFLPAPMLMIFYGARPSVAGILSGFISLFSAMLAWYVVDPITLFPILHVPGMYMTYIAGNSKEIRAPAAMAALSATDQEAGTERGTVVAALAISTSIFISIAVMTLVAVAGNYILGMMPPAVITALGYLLPALFGAMCMQRVMLDYRSALVLIPTAYLLRLLSLRGVFSVLPLGGGYAQVLLCVIAGVATAKTLYTRRQKKAG